MKHKHTDHDYTEPFTEDNHMFDDPQESQKPDIFGNMAEVLKMWQQLSQREQDIVIQRVRRPTDTERETSRILKLHWTEYRRCKARILKLCPVFEQYCN